jgi:hypothetical protein
MFDEVQKYKHKDHFFFKPNDSLSKKCNAPDEPGVFIIMALASGNVDLVYIGAAGTIQQNGIFKDQFLYSLINGRHGGMRTEDFFKMKMLAEEIEALDIYWYVTFDDRIRDLPGYVVALIMQRHFDIHCSLPRWNKKF